VTFDELSKEVIDAYIKTSEPFDKAGGYGLQSLGASFASGINGCYFNVMGFPAHRFAKRFVCALKECGHL